MQHKLLVFDSHPVQYRVPVWQTIEQLSPNILHVVYASDCSIKGYLDDGFGKSIAWDMPLLDSYNHTILNCENGTPLSNWKSLTGKGVKTVLNLHKPKVVLLTGLNYKYDWVVYFNCLLKGIPVWLRCETQDFAVERTWIKSVIRNVAYKIAYMRLQKVFYIGELNKQHYLKHGIPASKLFAAHYCTVDVASKMAIEEKLQIRNGLLNKYSISSDEYIIGFSGKFITKKNPTILFNMLQYLPELIRSKCVLYFIGSGSLENDLEEMAINAQKKYGIKTIFTGFVNQLEITNHYLALDVLVLPSKRMGETWGLVANEAMQAGCSVVVSSAVGCSEDFKLWERFCVFESENASELANKIELLYPLEKKYDWATDKLKEYSVENVAKAFIENL